MKLFSDFEVLMEDLRQPWYVANRPEDKAKNEIFRIAQRHNIPNLHEKDKYHCTLIYSKTPCKEPKPNSKLLIPVVPEKWDFFDTQDGKRCMVLKLYSPFLHTRHKTLMKQLEASYDFPSYKPHITISYDVGDLDVADVPLPAPFNLTGEYSELLDDLE